MRVVYYWRGLLLCFVCLNLGFGQSTFEPQQSETYTNCGACCRKAEGPAEEIGGDEAGPGGR